MGLLRDWNYIERAVEIPALSEMIREALIRALFVRDDRVLTSDIVGDLNRGPAVTVKVKDDAEVRKLVRVMNGEESAVSLGLSAQDYHYFRTRLGVGRTREFGVVGRPRVLLTYDWIVPEQRGVQLDFSSFGDIEFAEAGHRAIVDVGATWKRLHDEAGAKGHVVPFVPTVPLDFALGDAIYGDAPFASYRGEFGAHVNALRTISPYGSRTRIGFEEVANNGTAYDLLHATAPIASEFSLPLSVAVRLAPKAEARKTLTYAFDDGAKASAALDNLTRSGLSIDWVHVTDAVAAKILRPSQSPEMFTVQMSVGGTEAGLAAREKGIDAAMAGFKSRATDVPNPFEAPAEAFRKAAETVGRGLFVGEVRVPAKGLGDLTTRLRAYGDQMAAPAGLYASVRETGIVSLFPAFDAPKERAKMYDLSKGVNAIAAKAPGAVFVSRLAHLWSEEAHFRRRMDLLRSLKLEIDTAHVVQPLVAP